MGTPDHATLVDVLRARAEQEPRSVAFRFDEGDGPVAELTYGELDRRARDAAVALAGHARPGDRVLLLLRPGPDYLAAFFGCLYAGLVAVPAYPPAGRDARGQVTRLAALAKSAGPAVVLTHDEFLDGGPALLPGRARWLGERPDGAGDSWAPPPLEPATVAFVQYTSGSTAEPRGVVLNHANLLANLEVVAGRFGTGPESVGCSWLPPYHDMGLIGAVLQPVYRGFPMVLMAPESFVRDPVRWLRTISRHRVTVSGAPNFAYERCVRRSSPADRAGLDLGCWSVAFIGAEPVRAETLRSFEAAFGPSGFRTTSWLPCYGLAEATLMVTGGTPGRPPTVRGYDAAELTRDRVRPGGRDLVSCGTPSDGHEVIVVDPATGRPHPAGRVGELWVRGPSVAAGYWEDPAATGATFGARLAGRPHLRTGDLGFIDGGELFVTGRRKDLLIVRGRNHHPGDVEVTIAASSPVLRAPGAVFGVSRDGTEAVVAVHEARAGASDAELVTAASAARRAVAAEHGLHLSELLLVEPGVVPRTSSGKPRRGACRERYLAGELTPRGIAGAPTAAAPAEPDQAALVLGALELVEESAARRALLTTYLRLLLARQLRVPVGTVRPDEPVGGLGLDSLGSMELTEAVHGDLGVRLGVEELLGEGTPADLAVRLDAPAVVGRPVPRPDPGAAVPLSSAQQRLWFMHQLDPDSAAYTIAAAFRVRGPLDAARLAAALRAAAVDHEALRTVVRSDEGVPVQVVLPAGEIPLDRLDGSRTELEEWVARPFRLDRPPLVRAAVATLGPDEHLLAVAGHHVVFDAASIPILLADVGRHYAGTPGKRPAVQLADFARWQRTDPARLARQGEDLRYWRERLRAVPELGLPTDRPRPPVAGSRGAGVPFTVPGPVAAAVAALAREHRATPFMVLLAVWKLLLLRHGAQPDIAIGVPVSSRDTAGVAGTVGCFVDTLILRTSLAGDPTFAELVGRVRAGNREAYAHPAAPMERLVEELGVARHGRNPLFEASFSLFPPLDIAGALPGLELEMLEVETGHVQFDLVLEMLQHEAGLRGRLRYTSDLRGPATARRLADHLVRLLTSVTADPNRPLSEYPLVDDEEWAAMVARQPAADPFGPVTDALPAPFEAHAARHPDDVALVGDDGTWTYGAADARANQLAHLLRGHGVGPEVRVGLAASAGAGLVVAMLGILKSGGAYVPVEPTDPADRIRTLLVEAEARVVLADGDPVVAALAGTGIPVLRLDRDGALLDRQPVTRPEPPPAPENLAYVIFTSGSTGRPKGVAVEHRHIVSFVRATADYLGCRRGDRYAMLSSIAADLGLTTLLPALRTGGTVHVVPRSAAADPVLLAERFGDLTLDHLKIASSHLSALLAAPGGEAVLPVRMLVIGGEAVTWELVDRVRAYAPEIGIVNEYGPTETAVANIIHHVRPDGADRIGPLVPMTVSLGGNRAYVLDGALLPVPVGVPGELFLGGPQVARGYLNRPEATAERFRPDPHTAAPGRMYATGDRARWLDDTTLEFLGRIDDQVKIRGFRVEPGEIESVLRQHPAVGDAVVLTVRDPGGEPGLVAFVVAWAGAEAPPAELREHLRSRLPGHLVPAELVAVPVLPVLGHGKVDRDALLALPRPAPELAGRSAAPVDGTERELLAIWRDVLGVEQVGVDDNFFDLGGHSLLLARLQHGVAERLGRHVAVLDLMVHPTVRTQAAHLVASGAGTGTPTADPGASPGAEDPAVARARRRRDARARRGSAS